MVELRVPVSAPGAAQAAREVRQLSAETMALIEASTANMLANMKLTASVERVSVADINSMRLKRLLNTETQSYNATLIVELERLRRIEQQSKLTAEAQRILGLETRKASAGGGGGGGGGHGGSGGSYDREEAGVFNRLRRLAPRGGIWREAAKGVTEGAEGLMGAGGMTASMGLVGAGIAAVTLTAHAIHSAAEAEIESKHRLIEATYKAVDAMEQVEARVAGFGKDALNKHGASISSIVGTMGDAGVDTARSLEKQMGDSTVMEAFADMAKRITDFTQQQLAIQIMKEGVGLGVGSASDIMKQLNPERLGRANSLGSGGTDQVLAEILAGEDQRPSPGRIGSMRSNMRDSKYIKPIVEKAGIDTASDLSDQGHIGEVPGAARKDLAIHRAPMAAAMTAMDISQREEEEKLRYAADHEPSSLFRRSKLGRWFGLEKSARQKFEEYEDNRMVTANKMAPQAAAEGGGGGGNERAAELISQAAELIRSGGQPHAAGATP